MLCVAKNNNEYVEVTPVKVMQDNSLLNVIKGLTSGSTTQTKFELTPDMFDQTITFIQQYRFYGNRALTNVETPNNITQIYKYAFAESYGVNTVILPKVQTINEYAFSSAWVKQVSMPSIISIGEKAFNNNPDLTEIAIPNVNTIGNYAFYECRKLALIDFRGRTETTIPTLSGTRCFYATSSNRKFVVPDELYDQWIIATNWTAQANYIVKASEYTEA